MKLSNRFKTCRMTNSLINQPTLLYCWTGTLNFWFLKGLLVGLLESLTDPSVIVGTLFSSHMLTNVSGQYCWLQASYFFNSSFWTLCSTRTTHCAVHFSHQYICSLGFLYLSLQTSNSCLAFLKVLWPEMSIWDFYGAVLSYQWSYKALEVRSLSYTMYSTLFGSIFKDWVCKFREWNFPKPGGSKLDSKLNWLKTCNAVISILW